MTCKYGKLFKNTSTNKVSCFVYNCNQNYYAFIQNMLQKGYHQCIVTSDIMIKILEQYILCGNIQVTSIEFMIDDEELNEETKYLLKLMENNSAYWQKLKEKLSFLSQNDSIEMKKVNFRSLEDRGSMFSIQVNGIIIVSDCEFDRVSKKISSIVEDCIK